MINNDLRDHLLELGFESSIMIDDMDAAVIGTTEAGNVVYSYEQMINVLCDRDGMTWPEAQEYVDYNIARAIPYQPDPAPIILYEI